MDKNVEIQILTIMKNMDFDPSKFKFIKIKDKIFKMTFLNKFVTYIEINTTATSSAQSKSWTSYQKNLIEYLKSFVKNEIFKVVTLVDCTEKDEHIKKKCIDCLKNQTQATYIILLIDNSDDINFALKHNLDYVWQEKPTTYSRFMTGLNTIRNYIRETKNIMFCTLNDIFQNTWIEESLTIMATKCDVVGKDSHYLYDKINFFKLEINQEYSQKLIKHENWKKMCLFNGLMININFLRKTKWDIESNTFKNNFSLGIHEKIINNRLTIGYIKIANQVVLKDKIKSLLDNSCILTPLQDKNPSALNFVFSESTDNKDIVTVSRVQIPLIIKKKNITTEEAEKKTTRKMLPIFLDKKEVVFPMIIRKKDIMLKLDNEPKLIKDNNFDNNNFKEEKQIIKVNELKSPNKIITIFIVRNFDYLEISLKQLAEQSVKTDILCLVSDMDSRTYLEKNRINYLYIDSDNDKIKILNGLNYVRNMNPFFVMLLYDTNIISNNWVRDLLGYRKRYDLDYVGINSRFIFNTNNSKIYYEKYNDQTMNYIPQKIKEQWPLLEGCVIFNRILHKMNWNIFFDNLDIDIQVSSALKLLENMAKVGCLNTVKMLTVVDDFFINTYDNKYRVLADIDTVDLKQVDIKSLYKTFEFILGEYQEPILWVPDLSRTSLVDVTLIENSSSDESDISEIKDEDYFETERIYTNSFKLTKKIKTLSESNKIVQAMWIGQQLSLLEQTCILSFIKNGHEFHLYTYGEVKGIPEECVVIDGNTIIPESEIFYYSSQQSLSGSRSPAAFSNMFRYKLMYDKGGYWVDMDMICIRPFDFTDEYIFSTEFGPNGQTINAGVMKCPPKSDFAFYCYNICVNKDKELLKWGEIGPSLVREGVNRFRLYKYVKPWHTFCPINFNMINLFLDPYDLKFDKRWYGIHLWNEIWKKQGLSKNNLSFKFISQILFDVSIESVLNKAGVLITWLPINDMVDNYKNKTRVGELKLHGKINSQSLDAYINNDIYVNLMTKMKEQNIINDVHIVFGLKANQKDCYDNHFDKFESTHIIHKNIHFWKIQNLGDVFFAKHATLVVSRGYYEQALQLGEFKGGYYINYPATSLKQNIQNNVITDQLPKYSITFPYDIVLLDEISKTDKYKLIYPEAKNFLKFYKLGYDTSTCSSSGNKRYYDIIYCGSLQYPTKNTQLFLAFMEYLNNTNSALKICFVSKFESDNPLSKFDRLNIDFYINVNPKKMEELFRNSRNNLILSGRDANPRIISESLSCGCYIICTSTLSDGYSILEENPLFGKIIKGFSAIISQHDSASLLPSDELFSKINKYTSQNKNHSDIEMKFRSVIQKNYDNCIEQISFIYKEKQPNYYILTLATQDYLKPLNYLLSSLKYTNPHLPVIAICVNCNRNIINEFSVNYPDYKFIHYKYDNYSKADILRLKVKVQNYYFSTYQKPYIWIDADTIVTKSMESLQRILFSHDLMVYTRFNMDDYMKFAVGVIGYGGNIESTKLLLNAYHKSVMQIKGLNDWFQDQLALFEVYQLYKKYFTMYKLNESEHSLNSNKNSIIISRRANSVSLRKILDEIHCPIANINFSSIYTKYDY